MSFKSAYNHGAEEPLFSSSGNVMRTTMKWILDEEGKEILVEDKQYNIQDEINSYADECDIKGIVQRVAFDPQFAESVKAGLDVPDVDITNMPTNIHEAKKMADNIPNLVAQVQEEQKAQQAQQTQQEGAVNNEQKQ